MLAWDLQLQISLGNDWFERSGMGRDEAGKTIVRPADAISPSSSK
jgi:hypothetical protein